MTSRWGILAVLFAVRATMGFQFQSVAAVAPILMRDAGIGLADIGLLIGLYLAPGIAVALPGGALGRRFGDKTMVLAGLALMGLGGLLMAFWPSWSAQVCGRLLAGLGGVLLNVLMSKMVTDWFAGREIASAMAIFVNSWPVGIAAGTCRSAAGRIRIRSCGGSYHRCDRDRCRFRSTLHRSVSRTAFGRESAGGRLVPDGQSACCGSVGGCCLVALQRRLRHDLRFRSGHARRTRLEPLPPQGQR